jgi:Fic family protein
MIRGIQGTLAKQGHGTAAFRAFCPNPLPPQPELDFDARLKRTLSRADQTLGRLDGLSSVLPHPEPLIHFYIRKEAVLSSQIEGTQSTLSELLLFELDDAAAGNDDVQEVSNYVAAMRHGIARLEGGFPLSGRLLREMHAILLRIGRGSDRTPGDFRTSQNWIGGTRPGNALYVPPPVAEMQTALAQFEAFMNEEANEFPVLVQCALLHLQFETIHPFLDGNGRLGRLLMTLLLIERGVLTQPLLYLSLYLKQHKQRYYELLQKVRTDGDWEEWLVFFLEGVIVTSERAVALARQILDLFRRDEAALNEMGTRRGSALPVMRVLQQSPYVSTRRVTERTGLAFNTVAAVLDDFERAGLLVELTGKERGKIFGYREYLAMLDEGTEIIQANLA